MSSPRTIPKSPPDDPGLDQRRLFALGMDHVRRLAGRVWTDHNLHDPGITILELLCYALTDLGYRASLPIEDLLASGSLPASFPPAHEILPQRALTALDYRKLLIDTWYLDPEGRRVLNVRNAWIRPAPHTLYVDLVAKRLVRTRPGGATPVREVTVRGLHRVLVDLADPAQESLTLPRVWSALYKNRNLCEDFVDPIAVVRPQSFILCAEVELSADADVTETAARILFDVQQHFTPPVRRYTLDEMLQRRPAEEVFDGPLLENGFIDGDEIQEADLRERVLLSDVISVMMDVPGVQAIRDVVLSATDPSSSSPIPSANPWIVPVAPDHKPVHDRNRWRIVFRKRNMPIVPSRTDVNNRYDALITEAHHGRGAPIPNELPVPTGTQHDLRGYYSFQNHFPEIYGLSENGLPPGTTPARREQAQRLKGYLLFFDQVMANYCAQLTKLHDLLSPDSTSAWTYDYQTVDSFVDHAQVYGVPDIVATTRNNIETAVHEERRDRFLDHLIARYAEQFREHEAVLAALSGHNKQVTIGLKRDFLSTYPSISEVRGLGFDYSLSTLWDTDNVSGLEKRLAKLLNIRNIRRNLSTGNEEGMYVIENILLREGSFEEPLLPACVDPSCTDCSDDDPYSYRVHVILPEYAGRFAGADMSFRRYAEEVIREEMPAHVLPKVCWVSRADMQSIETAYRAWLEGRASGTAAQRRQRLDALVAALNAAKSVYPAQNLTACEPGQETPTHFILGQNRLGSDRNG